MNFPVMKTKLSICLGLLASALNLNAANTGLQAQLEDWAGERPGAIVAVTVDETGTHFYTAGTWSEAEPDRAITDQTAFEIGSISKVLTAWLAAEALADSGLSWTDAIPESNEANPLTFHQLATHTSGLPSLPGNFPERGLENPYRWIGSDAVWTALEVELASRSEEAVGSWSYSNFGFAVLGQSAAKLLQTDYERALDARVLEPLGLSDTWMSGGADEHGLDQLTPGHNSAGVASRWEFDGYAPAGAWVSTAADMAGWLEVMLSAGSADLPTSWAETWSEQAETGGPDRMGYGWMIREVGGADVHWHGGGTGGYRSFVGVQRETGRGIVVMGARDEDVAVLGLGWLQGLYTDTDEQMAEWTAADYVGDYPLAPEFVLAVFEEAGELKIQATGQPSFPLHAVGPDRFDLVGVPATVSFTREDSGEVTGLTLHQGGRDMPAERHVAGSRQIARPGIILSEAELEGLVGRYQLGPRFIIAITRSGDQLFAQATGQGNFPIYAEASDAFFYEVVEARITFQRDDEGNVTALTLHQGGRDMPARRMTE